MINSPSLPFPPEQNLFRPLPQRGAAFSLIELLTVLVIISLLAAGTVPLVRYLTASNNMQQAIYEVEGLLTYARNEAMVRQAYIWVGFNNVVMNDISQVAAVVISGDDGSASPATVAPLTRTIRLQNMRMTKWDDLKPATQALTNLDPTSLMESTDCREFTVGERSFSKSITFTPQGNAVIMGAPTPFTPYDPCIAIGLQETRGTTIPAGADDVGIMIHGRHGTVQSLRVH